MLVLQSVRQAVMPFVIFFAICANSVGMHFFVLSFFQPFQDYLQPEEIENFTKNIEVDESARFNLYKSLYFCSKDSDEQECKNQYKNDTSLGKLMLEHRLKGDVYNLLIDVLEAKNGGFNF